MKKYLPLIVVSILIAIGIFIILNNKNNLEQEDLSVIEKNDDKVKSNIDKNFTKKIKYLSATNAGLTGYFDDGTIATCSRCDFFTSNVQSLYTMESTGNWDKNKTPEFFDEDQNNPSLKSDWVIVDYEWIRNPTEY